MFKKLLSLTLALILCLSLISCDLSSLLEEPEDETQNTQLDGFNSAIKIEPYTIEYRVNGDGTCAVTNIVINSAIYSFSSSDKVTSDDSYIKYDSTFDGEYIISGNISPDKIEISTVVGAFTPSISVSTGIQNIDIVIPETNPDELTVTSIEFDGFDHIVPSSISEATITQIFNNNKVEDFTRQKFLAYYKFEEKSCNYILSSEISVSDVIEISKIMLEDMLLKESDVKNICSEAGEGASNIALKVRSITVPQTVESISDGAFAWCYNLEEYNISEGCEYNESIFIGSKFAK